uniref:Uncharacterized protein n=1 Tax=Brassica campestris TaxID=3711 RepID=A0A3P6AB23_BRACM|nr:unnamed protein product [Brassica rapa]
MGLGQSSSGTPWIAHSLFLSLLIRSINLSNQLLLKWVLVIRLQFGLMSMIPRKRLKRRGIQESTFFPEGIKHQDVLESNLVPKSIKAAEETP